MPSPTAPPSASSDRADRADRARRAEQAAGPRARPSKREARREDVTARILQIGRQHLAEQGAAALSLRAVTRDLGMVSSAVYRYVANRDDLLTLLVVDAYTELADAVDAALDAGPAGSTRRRSRGSATGEVTGRILTLGHAVRRWAVAEPARYALLYGSPVPGYDAPGEVTMAPGTRVVRRLTGLLDEAAGSGELTRGGGSVAVPRALGPDLTAVRRDLGTTHLDASLVGRGVFLWTALVGAVSAEVFGFFGAETFGSPETAFDYQLRLALSVVTGTP